MFALARQRIINNLFSTNKLGIVPATSIIESRRNISKEENFKFLKDNDTIYPPQAHDEERRKGYVCYVKPNIKYSPLKMWYISAFIRGMTVDEAVKQLSYLYKKGAIIAKEAILEAKEEAIKNHNIEYASDLWIAESYATKSKMLKGMRRHARGRLAVTHYRYCHLFLRLEEGPPPKHYYAAPKTEQELLENWMKQMHSRKITNSL